MVFPYDLKPCSGRHRRTGAHPARPKLLQLGPGRDQPHRPARRGRRVGRRRRRTSPSAWRPATTSSISPSKPSRSRTAWTSKSSGIGGRPGREEDRPPRGRSSRRTIYLLPHSHVDIGYSDLQVVVEKNHWKYFEQADRAGPPDGGLSAGRPLQMEHRSPLGRRDLPPPGVAGQAGGVPRPPCGRGWIGLQALLANVLTGVCSPEELFERPH